MTLPGGPADKLGNRYERWWTVAELLRMIDDGTDALRIEDPGVEKAEFVVETGSHREFHQAKRSHPSGKWTVRRLWSEGLLLAVGEQLAGNDNQFVFVSSSDAPGLRSLCEAARNAISDDEFHQHFLKSDERRADFEEILGRWQCNDSEARDRLRRIDVRMIDEHGLVEKVNWAVKALFLGLPTPIVNALRAIAEDSVHHRWTRDALVQKLESFGFHRRALRTPENAAVAVEGATDRYLGPVRRRLIRNDLVRNEGVETLLSGLGGAATDRVVIGGAGSGKSAFVVELVARLREEGHPVLALRLDRVPSTSTTPPELGRSLDLEESPAFVLAAAAKASRRTAVLIVDQLDAVSTMSGRSSGAFDLVESLVEEVRARRARVPVHTVVVCRTFDWENDSRLRRLVPPHSNAEIRITGFALNDVKRILASSGFDGTLLTSHQMELLRLPQNLSLFLEAGFPTSGAPAFDSATALFDRYWNEKRRSVAERIPNGPDQWSELMSTLCDEMTATQQLSVPKEVVDGFSLPYLEAVASEGVLILDGRKCGFGHESFFDYCFARGFVRERRTLVSFIRSSEQHLFRRAQVRQVLTYLRGSPGPRYASELTELLSDDGVRVHLKEVAFALLAQVGDPRDDEWAIWVPWLKPELSALRNATANPNPVSQLAWRKFFGSSSWFDFVDERGLIVGWLTSGSDGLEDMAVTYLAVHHGRAPDRVAALLEPHADRGGAWPARLRGFFQRARFQSSRRLFDLFLHLIDNGVLDDERRAIAQNQTFWSMIYSLSKSRPEWLPEILAHRLRRRLSVLQAAGEEPGRRELLGHDSHLSDLVLKSADKAPRVCVEQLLPVILEISDAARIEDELPHRDAVWRYLIKSDHPSPEDGCLYAVAKALGMLALEGKVDLSHAVAELRRRDTHTANLFLLALYAGGCEHHADEAATLLCDEPWRFACGYSDNPWWCAMEAIRSVFPHCSTGLRDRLESVILNFYPSFERTPAGRKSHGGAQFQLLSAIPADLTSVRVRARFAELERKFEEPEGEPRGLSGGWVRSPIDSPAVQCMSDDDWLGAIEKYHREFPHHSGFRDFRGGAPELAQDLASRVREDPVRFARLSLKFPSDANPVYLAWTLSALGDAPVATDLKIALCRKAFDDAPVACGRAIAELLASITDPLPEDALDILHWLITEHDDPAVEALPENPSWDGQSHQGNISDVGLNSTRGGVAIAISRLIRHDPDYIERLRPTLERMVRDPSPGVLAWVAETLRLVAAHDPEFAMRLFLQLNIPDERLLATRHVRGFVRERLVDHFTDLRPFLERMLRSCESETREGAASLASLVHLHGEAASDLLDEALNGDEHQRLGVAQVATENIAVPDCRPWSLRTLPELFNDDVAEVRQVAASCFQQLKDEPLDGYEKLIAAFCDSTAFRDESYWLLSLLEHSRSRLPGLICRVCDELLDCVAEGGANAPPGRVDRHTLGTLVFRTYQQHQDDEWTSSALDLIDRLCLEGPVEAAQHFGEFER